MSAFCGSSACWLLSFLLVVPFVVNGASASVGFTMTQGEADGKYVRFDQVLTNVQADLTKDLGAFRCQLPGLYYFSFTFMASRRDSCRMSLRRNRVPVVTAFASDNGFSWASSGAVLYLAQNDLVYLYLEDGKFHESQSSRRAFTSFSGFLVSEDALMGRNPPAFNANEGLLPPADPTDNIFGEILRHEVPRNATESGTPSP
ncbi:complement C1q tumor necrosis factor-related protein 4-like [Amblyomma americanum]